MSLPFSNLARPLARQPSSACRASTRPTIITATTEIYPERKSEGGRRRRPSGDGRLKWHQGANASILTPMEPSEATDTLIRLACFIGALVLFALLEAAFPRRQRQVSRKARWPSNLGISALNQLVLRLVLPASAIALAVRLEQEGWGLLAQLTWPTWIELAAAVLILDLAIYLQHRLYHAVPFLWRFHRMHHADLDFDVTTGIRFHPLSLLLSGLIKLGAVLIIGPSPFAVLVFEVLLNATTMFNHSNLKLPRPFDRILRLVIVTPDMHRVHHSADPAETNRNFGFNFPWWDRLFKTYRPQPALGHEAMTVGLEDFRSAGELRLDRMLSQPFRSGTGS